MKDRLIRTFVAISAPNSAKNVKQMLISTMEQDKAEIRWVKHSNLHLTVKFLGFTPENDISSLSNDLDAIAKANSPFDLSVSGTGCFPSEGKPSVLFLGISGIMVLYVGANVGYLYQLDIETIKQNKWVATKAVEVVMGATGGILISVAVAINAFGNISTQILCTGRSWHAMARDGLFFDSFKKLHPLYATPNNALIGQGAWATVLLTGAILSSYFQSGNAGNNMYETVIDFFSATSTIFNILTFGSIYILRKKYPDKKRPYKAFLYPTSMIVVLVLYTSFLLLTLITAPIPSLLGVGLTATGSIYYFKKVRT